MADVSCAAGELSNGGPRATQKVRPSGAYSTQRVRPGYPRVDQNNLQHQSGLFEGESLVPRVVNTAINL